MDGKGNATVDVIIPVYKPDERLRKLLSRLERQTCPIERVILLNTGKEYWKEAYAQGYSNVEVHHLTKEEFDHGGTRAWGASMSSSDILVFMTQDALPYDVQLIAALAKALDQRGVKAAYGRQLPTYDCNPLECYSRTFNYPEKSVIKSKEDLPRLGIKTYFCSNVCAAYDRAVYEELGGFVKKTIFNEDMIYASKLIQAGYRIAYAADAQVIHSHNYNCLKQFCRNFDLGVSQAEYAEVFEGLPSEGEGIRMVKKSAKYVVSMGRPWLLIDLFFQSAFKYLGFFLGKHYRRLPGKVVGICSMNKEYWTREK